MAPKTRPNDYCIEGGVAYVFLTNKKGKHTRTTIIDKEDLPKVLLFRWYYSEPYVATEIKGLNLYLHVFLMDTWKDIGFQRQVDHRDRNPLNNRRKSNLRIATQSQNLHNAKLRVDNKSGHKGVIWSKGKEKWQVYISVEGKRHWLGVYENLGDAVEVRKAAEKEKIHV